MSVYHNMEPYYNDYYSNSSSSLSSPSSVYSMNTDGNNSYSHSGSMSSPIPGNISPVSSSMSPNSSISDSSSAYNFAHLKISQHNELVYSMNFKMDGPYLEVVEQPIDKFRFRYESEMHGTHGMLTTQHSKKNFPSVRLRNFHGEALIRCSLFQIRTSSQDTPVPHSHSLVVRCGNKNKKDPHEQTVSQHQGYTANFQGMGIIHTARKFIQVELFEKLKERSEFESDRKMNDYELKELQSKAKMYSADMNLNQVSLCFEAYERVNGKWTLLCGPVFSAAINNLKSALTGELKISRMSTVVGSASGNDDLFMFVEKVGKKNIKVRFFELDDGGNTIWEDFGKFSEADVHHQYAIALKTPPYRRTNIDESVKVYIQLYRPKDEAISDPVEFRYKPSHSSNRKRARFSPFYDSEIPLPLTQNNYGHNSSDCYVPQSQSVPDDDLDKMVQDLFNSSQQEIAINLEDLSSYLGALNDTSEMDKLAKDSANNSDGNAPTLLKEVKWVEKVLDASQPLLKMKDNAEVSKIRPKFFKFILQKARFNGNSMLHICVRYDNLTLMKRLWAILHEFKLYELLELRNDNKETCVHLACVLNKPKILKELIKYGANVNLMDADGNTPLHIAIQEDNIECVEIILDGTLPESVKGLKLDLSVLNDNGYTPLHIATRNNNVRIIKLLDAKATNTKQPIFDDVEGKHGNNALHIAIEWEARDVFQYIIQNKLINPAKMNKSGHTAVYLARVTSFELLNLIQGNIPTDETQSMADDDDDASSKDSFDSQDGSGSTQTKKLMLLRKKIIDSNGLEGKGNEKNFDEQSLIELSEILNKNGKWKSIAFVLDFQDCIPRWHDIRNPTKKTLLMYAETLKVPKDTIMNVFVELDEKRAADCMREWKHRV